jgi:hypothetical protein
VSGIVDDSSFICILLVDIVFSPFFVAIRNFEPCAVTDTFKPFITKLYVSPSTKIDFDRKQASWKNFSASESERH